MMLPTLQMIEMYVIICSGVGELIPPVFPLSLQARSPTFVLRSTVACDVKIHASGFTETKATRTQIYQQVGVTDALIDFVDKV